MHNLFSILNSSLTGQEKEQSSIAICGTMCVRNSWFVKLEMCIFAGPTKKKFKRKIIKMVRAITNEFAHNPIRERESVCTVSP